MSYYDTDWLKTLQIGDKLVYKSHNFGKTVEHETTIVRFERTRIITEHLSGDRVQTRAWSRRSGESIEKALPMTPRLIRKVS